MKALAFSGGKDSMACLHFLQDLDCAIHVDTGFSYPETRRLVEYASSILPMHIVISNRHAQNEREGIPADVVPIDWTNLGQQITGPKLVQSIGTMSAGIPSRSFCACRFERTICMGNMDEAYSTSRRVSG